MIFSKLRVEIIDVLELVKLVVESISSILFRQLKINKRILKYEYIESNTEDFTEMFG